MNQRHWMEGDAGLGLLARLLLIRVKPATVVHLKAAGHLREMPLHNWHAIAMARRTKISSFLRIAKVHYQAVACRGRVKTKNPEACKLLAFKPLCNEAQDILV